MLHYSKVCSSSLNKLHFTKDDYTIEKYVKEITLYPRMFRVRNATFY